MMQSYIISAIAIPLIGGILAACLPQKARGLKETWALLVSAANLALAFFLFKKEALFTIPWAGLGIDASFRLYHFSSFILVAVAVFSFLTILYSTVFVSDKPYAKRLYSYLLLTIALTNGAVLANNLIFLLFFWEGLLLTLFGIISLGKGGAGFTAVKAFTIVGISDLCMMVGIALLGYHAGTFTISEIHASLDGVGTLAFCLLMIGALAKAGSMPFHSWIPDAAQDAPLPFMAFLPAALEKLLGIYFLARISFDLFVLQPGSALSIVMMSIGAITIIGAVMMALIQKDYKKLLAYHAISQVGYMVLGLGTALPIGIIGGLFHMINHTLYKSALFFSAGSVEKQAGTTSLADLGGLARSMPITFICFFVAALSICGVPPFNGFFSKELIYDAALQRGELFYLAAIAGSFFTAASFLKLGHAVYGSQKTAQTQNVRESSVFMLVPMIILAGLCVVFGLWHKAPLQNLIVPIISGHTEVEHGGEFPANTQLVIITVVVLLGAIIHHIFSTKIKGSALKAADYIHQAPGFRKVYSMAERRLLDPYEIGTKCLNAVSRGLWHIDRGIDWLFTQSTVGMVTKIGTHLRAAHNGNYVQYLSWAIVAGGVTIVFFILSH